MKKLIIFDLDGVLVDACEWHRLALNKALKKVCDYEISLEDHYSTYNGIPTKVKLNILSDKGIISKDKHTEVYDKKQSMTVDIIKENANIRPEKVEMIKRLKDAGHIVACYTNSIRLTAELMLEKTGVLDLLDCLITNQDVEKSKPNPEGYLFLVDKYNFEKDNVIIIEDSPKGLAAANASGCQVIKVKDPSEVDISLFKEIK